MAIYEEKEPNILFAAMLVVFVFVLAFPLWHIGDRDLFWNEGEYAAMATEMDSIPPLTMAHGELMPYEYPLYPLLVSYVVKAGLSMKFALRFIPILSLAVLSVLVFITCRRAAGNQAAAAGCAVMLSTMLVAEKCIEGYPHMLTVLLIFSGWLLWFNLGQWTGNWNAAWSAAGFFAGLAFYNGGWAALIFFSLPLVFQKRPLSIWSKLNKPGFYIGCAFIVFFIFLWGFPRWNSGVDTPFKMITISGNVDFLEYIGQIFMFPVDVAIRFMPWTLFLWAPFCPAIIPLDKNPLFAKFLRTAAVVTFVLLWVNPFMKGRDILFLAPVLATLCGLNYRIVVRRYGDNLLAFFRFSAVCMMFAGAACAVYHVLPAGVISSFVALQKDISGKSSGNFFSVGVVEAILAIVLAATALILSRKRDAIWKIYLLVFASLMLCFWSVVNPYRSIDRSRSELGYCLREAVGEDAENPKLTVYKDNSISGLYSECHYLGTRIKTLDKAAKFPDSEKNVYFISLKAPADPGRTWAKLLELSYKKQRLFLWKGVLKEENKQDERSDDGYMPF